YRAAAEERGIDMDYETAREIIYGMPYAEWKEKYQTEASPEQKAAREKSAQGASHRGGGRPVPVLRAAAQPARRGGDQSRHRRVGAAAAAAARLSADARDLAPGRARARGTVHRGCTGPARLRRQRPPAFRRRTRPLFETDHGPGHGE